MTTSASFLAGMLTITSDDNLTLSADTNNYVILTINGSSTPIEPTRTGGIHTNAHEVTEISIVDTGIGKTIDLRSVTKTKFDSLISTTITGGTGDDEIWGSAANDVIFANDGADFVDGGEGNDTIYGGAGDDKQLDGGEGTSSTPGNDVVFGGDGDDKITGSIGYDIYVGGNGKDNISADGSEGHILIGGDGEDILTGGPGSDVLVDGTTLHDSDMVALKAIRSAWISDSSYASRINNLLGNNSAATNAPYYLTSTTAVDDSDADALLGGTGMDWFLRTKSTNNINDLESGEWIGENSSTPAAHNDIIHVSSSLTTVTIPLSALFLNDGSPNGVIQLDTSHPVSSNYGTLTQTGDNLIWSTDTPGINDVTFSYFINNGNGEVSPTPATVTIHRGYQGDIRLIGDTDGDHENEILDFRPASGVIQSIDHNYAGAGSQSVTNWGKVSTASLWIDPLMGDFNGDGREDIAVRDGMTGQWNVWVSGESPNPTTGLVDGKPWGIWDSGWNWTPALVGDFNGDGRDDIFGFDLTHGDFYVETSTGTGFALESWGNIQTYLQYLSGPSLTPKFQAVDFDGDKRQDVLVYDSNGFQWAFVLSKGLHFSNISDLYMLLASSTTFIAAGNFDGSGGEQVLLQTRATPTDPYIFKLLKYNSNDGSSALEISTASWGTNSYPTINFKAVDVNQDGRIDLLGQNPADGHLIVGRNIGSSIATLEDWGDYYSNAASDLSWTYTSNSIATTVVDPTIMFDRFLEAFSWIYNNVELELYPGFLKGTEATRQTKAGNDWDQANLLIQDLRAQGINANYAYGRITAPIDQVRQWLSLSPTSSDQAVFDTLKDIANNPSFASGGMITFNHAWVKVTLPGASGNSVTFDVDPSWKFKDLQSFISTYTYTSNVRADYLNYWVTRDIADNPLPLPLEFFQQKVQDYLASHNGTDNRKSLADVTYDGPIRQRLFTAVTAPSYTLPSTINVETSVPQALTTKAILTLSNLNKTVDYWTQSIDVPSVSLSTVSVEWISPDEFGLWRNNGGTIEWYFDRNGSRAWESSDALSPIPSYGGASTDKVVIGDFNGDGVDQIAVYKTSNGDFYLDGGDFAWADSGVNGDYRSQFGVEGGNAVAGDWDGDGKDDIGVYISSTNTWKLDLDGNGVFESNRDLTIVYGATGATPLVGDWNGDGKSDLGYRTTSGDTQTFHLDVNGDYTPNGDWTPTTSLAAGDVPLAGDWDGDGWTDIAVFNAGIFKMMKLSAAGAIVSTHNSGSFGAAGDTPFAINIDPRSRGVLKIDGVAQSASLSSSNPLLADETQVNLQVKRYDWNLSSGVQSSLQSRDYIRPSGQTLVLAIQALQQSSSLLEQARADLNNVLADAIQPSTAGQGLPDLSPRVVREIAQLAGVQYFHVKMESDFEIAGLTNSLIAQNFVGLGIITVSEDFDYNESNAIPYIPEVVFVDIKDLAGFPLNRESGQVDVDVIHLVLDNSSALESYVIETLMNTDSISTIKGIALANYVNRLGSANPVYNLEGDTPTNRGYISSSEHSTDVKNVLYAALANGAKLMFAKQETNIGTWTGSVYLSELINSNTFSIQYAINKDGQTYDGGYRAGSANNDSFYLPQSSFQSFAGDPVKIDTGSYYREDTDISIPNLGKALELVRYYGSQESDSDASHAFRDLGFGYGWRDSYSDFLRLTKGTNWATDYTSIGNIEWYTPKGTKFTFTRNSNGTYSSPSSLGGTLYTATVSPDGVNGFRYVDVDGTTYLFETIFHDGSYYDSAGTARLIKITDRYGNGIKVTYATTSYSSNHFTGTIFANGEDTPEFLKIASVEDNKNSTRKLTFGYTSSTSHIHTITDWNSRVWTYAYESLYDPRIHGYRSILTSVTTPADSQTLARTLHYSYYKGNTAAIGLMKSYTDAAGAITSMEYYANRKLMRTVDPLGGVNFFTYDIFHQNTSFINERGEKEKYRFDSKGREIAKLSTDGSLETYAWDDTTDRMTSKTDAFGYTTSYTYTTNGLLDTLTTPNNIITDYTYGAFGNAIQIDRKVGSTSSLPNQTILNNYDSLGRLIWSRDAVGNYTLYGYGATAYDGTTSYADRGLPNAMTTARGVLLDSGTPIVSNPDFRTYYLYNAAGQVTGAKQGVVQFMDTYSNEGYLISHQTATGEKTIYSRNLLGEALTTTQVAAIGSGLTAIATSSSYDLDGRMLASTDALGRVTRYIYDTKGRLTSTILPDLTQIQNEYDAVGNLIKTIDQIGRETRYVYDSRNRLISTVFADGAVERIRYDADGQVIARWDGNGNETDFSYDKMGRLVRETKPDPDSDLAKSSGVGLNGGQTVSTHYLYDDTTGGKLKETRQEYGSSTSNVRMSTLSFYDAADRLVKTEEVNLLSANKVVSVTIYAYDANSNLINTKLYDTTSQTTWTSSTNITPADLASMATSFPSTLRETQIWYDVFDRAFRFYDALNHFTARTYDDAGRILTVTDKLSNVTTNHYDGFGRLDSITAPPAHSGESAPVTHYSYDPTIGRMISQTDPMGNVTEFTYDALDRKIAVTKAADVIDAVTQYVFDAAGQLISTVDPMGRADHSIYDLRGRVVRYDEPDPDGIGGTRPNVTQYAYDGASNLIKQTDASGSVTIYGYDHWNRVQYTLAPDPDGPSGSLLPLITISGYDAWGNSTSTWEGFYSIGSDGTPSIITGSGLVRKIDTSTFDYKNRVATQNTSDPDAKYAQVNQAAVENGSNIPFLTEYFFNGFGDLTKTHSLLVGGSPGTHLFHYYTYDSLGRQIGDGTSNNNSATDATYITKTSTFYDDNGNVTTVKTRLSYDSVTGIETTVDANYTYDNLGRLETSTNPDPDGASSLVAGKTTYAYDLNGNLLSKSVRIGTTDVNKVAVTNYGYDALNRLISTTEPGPTNNRPITTKTYDRAGELTSTTDAEGNRTRYVYDYAGRVTEEISPERYTRSYTYNEFGELVQQKDRDGRITAWEYDALGRVTKEKWFNSDQNPSSAIPVHTIMNEYDSFGRLLAIKEGDNTSNPSTVTISYTYDNKDRVTKVTGTNVGAQGYSIEYSYDADQARQIDAYVTSVNPVTSNVDKIAHIETDYEFDGGRRIYGATVRGIADTGNTQATVARTTYDKDGNFNNSVLLNNGGNIGTIAYTYDDARRLKSLTYNNNSTTISKYNVTYNAADWIMSLSTSQTTAYADSPATYTYDDRGQLTDAVYSNSSYVADLGYDYDLTGNRTDTLTYDDTRSSIISTSNYDTATGNRLTSDGTYSYEYDKEGHLITKTTMISDGSGGQVSIKVATYDWDHRGRMTDVTLYTPNTGNAIQTRVHYTYDALDHRIRRQIDSSPLDGTYEIDERYIYDGDKLTFVVDGNSSTFDTMARYAYLPNAPATLARIGSNAYWLLTDEQGSVKDVEGISMSSATPAQHIRYDAFGNAVSTVGSLGGTPIAHLGYTGQELDSVTGLLNYGARWYDPKTGRFISQDPSGFDGGKDMNLYRYVGNNASTLVDPTGLVAGSPSFGGGYSPVSTSNYTPAFTPMSLTGTPWNASNSQFDSYMSQKMTLSSLQNTNLSIPASLTQSSTSYATSSQSEGWFSSTYNYLSSSLSTGIQKVSNFISDASYITASSIGNSVSTTFRNGQAADSAYGFGASYYDKIFGTDYSNSSGIYGHTADVQGGVGVGNFTQEAQKAALIGYGISNVATYAPKVVQTTLAWGGRGLDVVDKGVGAAQIASGDINGFQAFLPGAKGTPDFAAANKQLAALTPSPSCFVAGTPVLIVEDADEIANGSWHNLSIGGGMFFAGLVGWWILKRQEEELDENDLRREVTLQIVYCV